MISLIFNGLLKLLEKLGRHEVLVDAFGQILWRRYYLFYFEKQDNPRWIDYLPNVHINIFENENVENEDEHNHPWSTLSVMVKGGYIENINHSVQRETTAPGLAYLSYKDTHRLSKMTTGTITFFIHGFRRADWKFHLFPHQIICDFCKEENGGKCDKKLEVLNYTEYTQRGDGSRVDFSKTRTMVWETVNDDFRKRLEKRQTAIKRLGTNINKTKENNRRTLREIMFRRNK